MTVHALPLFPTYAGADPADQGGCDFILIGPIAPHGGERIVRAHRHRTLFQIVLLTAGAATMSRGADSLAVIAPCAVLVPPTVAHGYRFGPESAAGWMLTFSETVARDFGPASAGALARLHSLAADPVVPLAPDDVESLSALAVALHREQQLAREGAAIAIRGHLALIATAVARIAARRGAGDTGPGAADPTVAALLALIEEHFRKQHLLAFYAGRLAMTPDRLNERIKRATGVTAGHLIRQRILVEAKSLLALGTQPIHDIARDLAFFDPSHFARFFRKHAGLAPQDFRARAG